MKYILLLLILGLSPNATLSAAEPDKESVRQFTSEQPLVYEDAWDLWPYVFLNENGEAVGYNVDVLKLIFQRLNIPYVIKLKPTDKVMNDLREGMADLTLGMEDSFHQEYGQFGKAVIHIFTHSIVHRADEPVRIKNVNDLKHQKIIVHKGSFSYYLMMKNGWVHKAVPYNDMQDAVQLVHNQPGYQIIWNTLSLKWLLHKFHYDDLELTPVKVQHGEYKFMSNNPRLLHQLDSVYAQLDAEGHLRPIQNKWFYPDRKDSGIPSWIWIVIIALLLFTVVSTVFYTIYRKREKRMTKNVRNSNRRLSLILKTSNVHIWVYDLQTKTITTYDENGAQKDEKLTPNFFFYSVVQDDFQHIMQAFFDIASRKVDRQTLDVQLKDGPQGRLRNLTINLSVFRRNKNGKPTDIIGTTSDITEERLRQQQAKDNMLRYRSVFNSAMVDIVAYDSRGIIIDMNEKAQKAFPNGINSILDAKISLADVLGIDSLDINKIEYTYMTQLLHWPGDDRALARLLKRDEMFYELQMTPLRDATGKLLAVYVTGHNVTDMVKSYRTQQANILQLQHANNELESYIRNIDYVLENGGIRVVTYSLDTHTLVIYSEVGKKQMTLTQTRALSLTHDSSKRTALHAFNSMDRLSRSTIKATVKTRFRHHGGGTFPSCPLCLYLSLVPTIDEQDRVTGYFGMCRDLSVIKATEESLALEAAKAQEVETVKNAFLRNMSYQIRTPLNSVVGFSELFEMEHDSEDEPLFIKEISDNASLLLELINDILFLSRLDAHMIEFKKEPINFATFFEARCQTAWLHYKRSGVEYVVDSAYKSLVLNIDSQNVGVIVDQILANAAQHTSLGEVRASFDYNGDDLIMTFQDTGCGIPKDQQQHIFDRFATTGSRGTGLGLCICLEITQQMGGKIRVHSEVGKGTIVWVTIPCHCNEVVRKQKGEEA